MQNLELKIECLLLLIIIKRMDAQYGDAHNLEMDFTISQKKIKKSFKMFNWLIILMFY